MSYKQILTTNDIGAEANQVAAGNHNHDSNYVKKSGDTMTGLLKVTNAPILSDIYASNKNFPAYVFDKPGSHYTGIGSHGNSNEIFFGAVNTSDYTWIDDYKQKWHFNGTIQAPSGFTSDDSCSIQVMGQNELNFCTSYTQNDDCWINYRTPNGNVERKRLIIGNGTAGRGYVTAKGYSVSTDSGTDYMFLTRDDGGAQYYGLWDSIAKCWALVSDGSYTRLQENIHINKELMVGGDGGKGHIRLTNGSTSALLRIDGANFWILGSDSATFGDNWKNYSIGHPFSLNLSDGTLHTSRLFGAVWNDYAECREADTIEPGKCVIEVGDDTLITSTKRLMPSANITSDTFGFSIGETEQAKTPIAVSGRVLAYPYESREEFKKNIGRPVCSGPNGTVSIMTDEEYRDKGYCAIGTISAVPDYEEWGTGKVKVNGRVWIKVF